MDFLPRPHPPAETLNPLPGEKSCGADGQRDCSVAWALPESWGHRLWGGWRLLDKVSGVAPSHCTQGGPSERDCDPRGTFREWGGAPESDSPVP